MNRKKRCHWKGNQQFKFCSDDAWKLSIKASLYVKLRIKCERVMNLIGLARFMPFMIALVWYENIIRTPNLVTLNKWFHVTAYDILYLDMCFEEFSVFIDSFLLLSVKKNASQFKICEFKCVDCTLRFETRFTWTLA